MSVRAFEPAWTPRVATQRDAAKSQRGVGSALAHSIVPVSK